MKTSTRRTRWIAGLLVLAAFAVPQITAAQAPDAEWAFNPMGAFADERVQLSMRLQMDAASAGAASGVTLDYLGGGELPPPEDASILLEAAGILPPGGTITGVVIERPCRVWAADESLAPAALALGEELPRVWSQYGVDFAPCGLTDDPTIADVLVFSSGQPPADVDLAAARPQGSFLSFAEPSGATPGTTPGGTGGTGGGTAVTDPVPAQGGSGGDEASSDTLAMAVGAVLALGALAAARGLTGIRPS